jgi:ABC-type transporter Mla MlaB component
MLKISRVNNVNGAVTLKIEGRLVGPWVAELCDACQSFLAQFGTVKLDLADLSYVDADGAIVLTELKSRGVLLENQSPLVDAQLTTPMSNYTAGFRKTPSMRCAKQRKPITDKGK